MLYYQPLLGLSAADSKVSNMTKQFPDWIRRKWSAGPEFHATDAVLREFGLHTVCVSARCPNRGECWQQRIATLMVLGDVCTRNCAFCAVKTGVPAAVDADEPARVGQAVAKLGLHHAVITSAARDDLPDGGSGHFAWVVEAVHAASPATTVEVLTPDFEGVRVHVERVLQSRPEVFGHNIETVEALYPVIRDQRYAYRRSLEVLRIAAQDAALVVKSGFMVGHGETREDIEQTLGDLREAGCRAVSIGQYLRPSSAQRPVCEYVTPEAFASFEAYAREVGFEYAVAGPFVRSSYRAEMMYGKLNTRCDGEGH